jgi:hypothetical protein
MELFHLNSGLLGPGSIIHPGNWGRVLMFHGWNHHQAAREMMLESARINGHADKPSRLKCCFAFLTIEEADRFRPMGFDTHILYRVALADHAAATFTADTALCTFDGTPRIDWGNAYWNGVTEIGQTRPPHVREVLTLSPLKILEQV